MRFAVKIQIFWKLYFKKKIKQKATHYCQHRIHIAFLLPILCMGFPCAVKGRPLAALVLCVKTVYSFRENSCFFSDEHTLKKIKFFICKCEKAFWGDLPSTRMNTSTKIAYYHKSTHSYKSMFVSELAFPGITVQQNMFTHMFMCFSIQNILLYILLSLEKREYTINVTTLMISISISNDIVNHLDLQVIDNCY